ncbi:hypothetical protein [Falsiroseomonas sp.]|uniref:hypothetical protein n=1 Tax=Falsiroseomonas sp. TaxID=2870721 RepID=UPI003F6E632B
MVKKDRDALLDQVNELIQTIEQADVSEDLRAILRRNASLMAFALVNTDLLGLDGVYDVLGGALMAARRAERAVSPEEDEEPTTEAGLLSKFKTVGMGILKAADAADRVGKGVRAVESLGSGLGFLPGSG